MPKDKAYWKDYNQKRKAYLSQKKREARERLKALSTTNQTAKVVDTNQANPVVDIPKVVDNKPKLVVDCSVVDIARRKVVDKVRVVDQRKVVDNNPKPVVDQLTQLIHQYQTATNYHCAFGCSQNKYCSNCWYFAENQLIDYKSLGGNHA